MTLTFPCLDLDLVGVACLVSLLIGLAIGQALGARTKA